MDIGSYLRERRGRAQEVARRMQVSGSLVVQWGGGKPVAIERCPDLELATDGCVPCEHARPDIAWLRWADPAWPYHPDGRPLIDVSRSIAANQPEARHAA